MSDDLVQRLGRDYLVALMRYLPARAEAALATGYEIGRRAIEQGTSLQDLVHTHHAALARVIVGASQDDPVRIVEAAGEFLAEVLAAAELAQRAIRDRGTGPATQR